MRLEIMNSGTQARRNLQEGYALFAEEYRLLQTFKWLLAYGKVEECSQVHKEGNDYILEGEKIRIKVQVKGREIYNYERIPL